MESCSVQLSYNNKKHKVDSYGLVYHHTKHYLLGYAHDHKETRAFSVNKIKNIKLSNGKFVPPADFDAQNYWQKKFWKKYYKKAETIVLIFKNSPFEEGKEDVLLERIKNWKKINIKKLDEKRIEATFKTLNFEWLIGFVLSCGKRVKVKKPKWLKEKIKEEIQEMKKLYK